MRFGNHFETSKEPAKTTLKHRSEPPQQPGGYSGNKKQKAERRTQEIKCAKW
jgi:hypothetical protein